MADLLISTGARAATDLAAPRDDPSRRTAWMIGLAALAFHILGAALVARFAGFPCSLDEIQHLSYARWMEAHPALFPRFETMPTLDSTARAWTATPNYLNHPSPYYLALGWLEQRLGLDIFQLRLVNLALSGAAMALMLAAGFQVLHSVSERWVFAATLVLFPKLGVVSGIISNDNAALLAASVGFAGLIGWTTRGSRTDALLLAFGLALAGWTKLTVLVMLACGVGIAELLRLAPGTRRPPRRLYGALAVGALAAAVPTLQNFAVYGRAVFHPSNFFVPAAERTPMGVFDYAALFARQMGTTWSAVEPAGAPEQIGLVAVLGFAAAACVLGWRALRRDPDAAGPWLAAMGLILAIIPTLAQHFYYGWAAVLEDGYLYSAQARYYYGLWPGVALGLALVWRSLPGRLPRYGMVAVLSLLIVASPTVLLSIVELRGDPAIH